MIALELIVLAALLWLSFVVVIWIVDNRERNPVNFCDCAQCEEERRREDATRN